MSGEQEIAGALTDRCLDRVGDALRTVTVYDDDGFERAYVRDDVEAGYSRARFSALVANARDVHAPLRRLPSAADDPIGRFDGTVHVFENAVVVQLVDGARGYLVSVDRGSDDPEALLAACRDAL